jgi:hypothetical protein
MSIIALGAAALAIYLGLIHIRFWWHGLAALAGAALLVAIVSIAAMQSSTDPLVRADNSFSASSIARGALNALIFMLVIYGAARGLRWLFARAARSKRK